MNNMLSSIRFKKEVLTKLINTERCRSSVYISLKKSTSNTILATFLVFVLMLTFDKHSLFFISRNRN